MERAAVACHGVSAMQAVWYEDYGPPSVLRVGERDTPEPGVGQLRVRLLASALAQIDVKLRAGALREHFALSLPNIPGRDGDGVVDAVGPGVAGWRLWAWRAPAMPEGDDSAGASGHDGCSGLTVGAKPGGLGHKSRSKKRAVS